MQDPGGSPLGLNARRRGSGEPLVLLHGLGSALRAWNPVLAPLERAHEVLALDLPGFGESPPLPAGRRYTVPSLADAVEHELAALGVEMPYLAGNSLGGWIALELARRGRARSVVALSPAGMWTPRENAYATGSLRIQRAIAERLAHHADALTRTAAGRTALFSGMMSRPWLLKPAEAAYAIRAAAGAPGWHGTLDWMSSNRASGLDQIRCPVRIAWGDRDRLLLPRQARRCARMIAGAELKPLPGLGHVPMSDDAGLVARTILEVTAGAAAATGTASSQASA